jgi:hypothetical protein
MSVCAGNNIGLALSALRLNNLCSLSDDCFKVVDEILIADFVVRLTADINQITRRGTSQANVGFARLTRAIHDAANDRNVHRRSDVIKTTFQGVHRANHIKVLSRATWAGNKVDAISSQLETLEDLETHFDFLDGVSG